MTQLEIMGANAKQAARVLMNAGAKKDEALLSIAQALRDNAAAIIAANEKDIENGKAAGLTPSLLDRLKLDESRIAGMAEGVTQVAAQPDPIGRILEGRTLKNGLQMRCRRPLSQSRQRGDPARRQGSHQLQQGNRRRYARRDRARRTAA